MHKTKPHNTLNTTLLLLITLLTTLTTTTTPANAWFQANTAGATTGTTNLPETATFNQIQGGTKVAVVTCTNNATSKAAAFWTIQNSEETITKNTTTKEQKQPITKEGPHEAITIQRWGTCKLLGIGLLEITANLSECRLQIAQPNKNTAEEQSGLGSVQTDCTIEIPGFNCSIVISQTKTNHNLRTVILKKIGTTEVEINAEVTGITDSVVGAGCATDGLTGTTTATFTANGIKNVGQTLI